jgi:predicted LPLAT superfamily acyltransferase
MSTGWRHQPERGSRKLIRLLAVITLWLGRPVARGLLYPICLYFLLFSGGTQRTSRDYLRRILNRQPSWRDVFRHYHAFASTIHDRVYLLTGRHRYFDIRMAGLSGLRAVLAQNRGCILLGSHLGSFEVLRAHGLFDQQLPITVIMHEAATSNLNAVLHSLRPEIRERIIPPGTPDTMLAVKERLDNGEMVGILGDRVFGDEKGVICDFLGKPRTFAEGPFLLSALLHVPIVLFFGLYQGGRRYDIHFEPFADNIHLTRGKRSEALRPWVERYVDRLEHYCRLSPYNWFNFYDVADEPRPSHTAL